MEVLVYTLFCLVSIFGIILSTLSVYEVYMCDSILKNEYKKYKEGNSDSKYSKIIISLIYDRDKIDNIVKMVQEYDKNDKLKIEVEK